MDGKTTGTRSKLGSLSSMAEENIKKERQTWDDFRNQHSTTPTNKTRFDSSVLTRLENEDVEDISSTVGYLKHIYTSVIDPELIEYFNQYDSGDGFVTNTREFSYIRQDGKLYRRRLFPNIEMQDMNFTIKPRPPKLSIDDKNDQDLSELGASLTTSHPLKIMPQADWKKTMYSDLAKREEKNSKEVEKYIEFTELKRKGCKENAEINLLSSDYLDKLQKEVNVLKRPLFEKLKDKYISDSTTFQVSKSQYLISKQVFDLQLEKPERNRDDALIAAHLSLKSSLEEQEIRLKKLGSEIVDLAKRKSPYYVSEITMPKLGTKDTFDHEAVKMFPIVASDDDISIKDLFEWLSSWAEDIGLSEKALKRVIFSRLRGQRQRAWLTYQKQPLKEAITSLSLLFDKNETPQNVLQEIKQFSKGINEDIQNSCQRLIRHIDKYLENRTDHDRSILRREYLLDKLDKLLSPRALREVFRIIEQKQQLGETMSEQDLLSSIYKEDMFDKRIEASQNGIRLNNVSGEIDIPYDSFEDHDSLSDFNDLEINAAEHKRKFEEENTSFKHARTDERRKLSPVRRQGGSAPIVIGAQGKPLIRVGNPNPNNKWHNRTSNSYGRPNQAPYTRPNQNYDRPRQLPFQQQQQPQSQPGFQPQMRYSRDWEVDRRPNDYNGRPHYQNYNTFNNRQRNTSFSRYNNTQQSAQSRNSFNQNRGNLKQNLQFRANPPALFQQITLEGLNSICVECPKEDRQHRVAECPKLKVFRQAKDQEKWT